MRRGTNGDPDGIAGRHLDLDFGAGAAGTLEPVEDPVAEVDGSVAQGSGEPKTTACSGDWGKNADPDEYGRGYERRPSSLHRVPLRPRERWPSSSSSSFRAGMTGSCIGAHIAPSRKFTGRRRTSHGETCTRPRRAS